MHRPDSPVTVVDIDQFDITINPINDNDPMAQDHDYTGNHREQLVVSLLNEGLLSDATDADLPAEELTAQVVTEPAKGNLNLNADGTLTYTPPTDEPAGQLYEDSFTYKVLNGDRESVVATVELTIQALPGPSIDMGVTAEL
ncbi:Ig-like domain-containing protein, partial [bacterium]|nr:Ig-like domain-containing protein [bacterium]